MISRVAESCYWLMRYVERCDTTARLLRVHSDMVLDNALPAHRMWRPLLIVSGVEPSFDELHGSEAAADGDRVQEYLTWDESNPSSIFSTLRAARENARTVRETISLEMWNGLNSLWLWLAEDQTRTMYDTERQVFYDHVNDRCHAISGVTHKTMLHEEPFDFMQLGLNLERAGQTARILDLHHHALGGQAPLPAEAVDAVEWIAILRSRYAYEPFFKKRGGALAGPAVAEFLLRETAFPSSVVYALSSAQEALGRIRPTDSPFGRRSAELLRNLGSAVVGLDVARAIEADIHDVLTDIVDHTVEVSQAIGEDYFYAVLPPPPAEAEALEA